MATQYDDRIEALTRISETFVPPQRVKDEAFIKDYDPVYATVATRIERRGYPCS